MKDYEGLFRGRSYLEGRTAWKTSHSGHKQSPSNGYVTGLPNVPTVWWSTTEISDRPCHTADPRCDPYQAFTTLKSAQTFEILINPFPSFKVALSPVAIALSMEKIDQVNEKCVPHLASLHTSAATSFYTCTGRHTTGILRHASTTMNFKLIFSVVFHAHKKSHKPKPPTPTPILNSGTTQLYPTNVWMHLHTSTHA